MNSIGVFVFGSILVGFVAVFLAFHTRPGFKDSAKYKLVIGILSARHNFEQRKTIRSTWLSVLNNTKVYDNIFSVFILANADCNIPIEYRKNKYLCEEAKLPDSVPSTSLVDQLHNVSFSSLKFEEYNAEYASVAFDFTVIFDVIVSGITIPIVSGSDAVIQLWDLASEIMVLESRPLRKQNDSLWNVAEVPAHLLPKGFVGTVIVLCGKEPCRGMKEWDKEFMLHPSFEISPILRYSRIRNEFPDDVLPIKPDEMLLPAFLIIEFADHQKIDQFLHSREKAFQNWSRTMKENNLKLKSEIERHNDILLLRDVKGGDLIEVYRNLPRKVVSFYHWSSQVLETDFIMKTDDDSYVDVEKVYQEILKLDKASSDAMWIGNFRRDWIVDRWGKWAEHHYTAPVYPAYACGAGNLITSEISHYISKNKNFLRYYQGEDVSMGIWLSALNVKYVQDDLIVCDDSCHPNMVASTQHTTYSLRKLWKNKEKCDNPCGC